MQSWSNLRLLSPILFLFSFDTEAVPSGGSQPRSLLRPSSLSTCSTTALFLTVKHFLCVPCQASSRTTTEGFTYLPSHSRSYVCKSLNKSSGNFLFVTFPCISWEQSPKRPATGGSGHCSEFPRRCCQQVGCWLPVRFCNLDSRSSSFAMPLTRTSSLCFFQGKGTNSAKAK